MVGLGLTCPPSKRHTAKMRYERVYKFRVSDLVAATNCTEWVIYKAIKRGQFDPRNIKSVSLWVADKVAHPPKCPFNRPTQ